MKLAERASAQNDVTRQHAARVDDDEDANGYYVPTRRQSTSAAADRQEVDRRRRYLPELPSSTRRPAQVLAPVLEGGLGDREGIDEEGNGVIEGWPLGVTGRVGDGMAGATATGQASSQLRRVKETKPL